MAKPLTTPENDSAFKYAFVLALSLHLSEVETKFNALPAEDFQSLEETLWAQDLSTNLHLVREYGLKKVAKYFRKQDITINCPQGQYKQALTYSMEEVLLGPKLKKNTSLSTEQILSKVDDVAKYTGVLLYTGQLSKKLSIYLKNAVKAVVGDDVSADLVFKATSQVLAHFLDHADTELSPELDFGALTMQIESAKTHLTQDSTGDIDYNAVFKIFRATLVSQLELATSVSENNETTLDAVLRLRELGNNLTNLLSYPQAIRVYTEALDLCDWTCTNNIPQLYTNRAISFIGLNCFEEAVTDLNNAICYDRSFTPALAQLGYCHLYLGSGVLALACYVAALRSLAGEIYPENFPQDQELRATYTNLKVSTVVPQFVQRLVQLIILSEKRATQQRHPATAIQEHTTRTRAILARLRAAAAPEDLHYFSYSMENSVESVRATAARANRMRPSILTPEVAQDVMASTGVEASAVSVPVMSINRPARANTANTGNAEGNATARATAGTATATPESFGEDGIRSMLNNIGEAIGGMVQAQTEEFFNQQEGGTGNGNGNEHGDENGNGNVDGNVHVNANDGPEVSVSVDNGTASASASTSVSDPPVVPPTGPQSEAQNSASFRNSFNSFIPNIGGNLGNIISQALRHHLQVAGNIRAGQPGQPRQPGAFNGRSTVRVHQSGPGAPGVPAPNGPVPGVPVVHRVIHGHPGQPGQPGQSSQFPPRVVRVPGLFPPGQPRRVVRVTPHAQARAVQLSVTAEDVTNVPENSDITPASSRALSTQPDTEMADAPDAPDAPDLD